MYILTFNRSRSKYFEKGLNLAERLGGVWDGQEMTINMADDQLLNAYELLLPLFEIIQNWSSTRATFHGRKVHPYKFILSTHFLNKCGLDSNRDSKNCWLYYDCPGWSCKKLTNIFFLELGNGKYKNNDRYWYNFGSFNSKNEWVIDKPKIFSNLIQFAENNGLYVCPHFSAKRVKDSVDNLHSKIIPDDVTYRIHFTDMYSKGEKLKFPENIRHISQTYEDQDGSKRIKYDPTKITPIRHHKKGTISAEALEELLRKNIEKN